MKRRLQHLQSRRHSPRTLRIILNRPGDRQGSISPHVADKMDGSELPVAHMERPLGKSDPPDIRNSCAQKLTEKNWSIRNVFWLGDGMITTMLRSVCATFISLVVGYEMRRQALPNPYRMGEA